MPNNYKETIINGAKWTRSNRVVIDNPYGGFPTITFSEQTAVVAGNEVVTFPETTLTQNFKPSSMIPILNPDTNEYMGYDVSHMELYMIIYSLYMQMAQARDARLNPPQYT